MHNARHLPSTHEHAYVIYRLHMNMRYYRIQKNMCIQFWYTNHSKIPLDLRIEKQHDHVLHLLINRVLYIPSQTLPYIYILIHQNL